jgi:hypothetical protein
MYGMSGCQPPIHPIDKGHHEPARSPPRVIISSSLSLSLSLWPRQIGAKTSLSGHLFNAIGRRLCSIICACISLSVTTTALAAAPYLRSDRAIKDEQGRIEVIVDFADDAHLAYPDSQSSKPDDASRFKERFMPMPQTALLVEAFERNYGFKRTGMTSWVGNSVTAFLTPAQIERLQSDKAVKQISDNTWQTLSATRLPPWGNVGGSQWRSWGHQAVSGTVRNAGNSPVVVYVVDSGVADHTDLNMHPTFPRVNVACGSGGNCDTVGTAADRAQYPVVGCYAHATHVAGIIGARDNNAGTVGIYAGVKLRSVSVVKASGSSTRGAGSPLGSASPATGWCANLALAQSNPTPTMLDPSPTAASVGYAFDWIYNRILFESTGVAIVNLSINPGAVGFYRSQAGVYTAEPNNAKIKRLATPGFVGFQYYAGAFVAQSAGNTSLNACRNCDSTVPGFNTSYACLCSDPNCAFGNSQAYQSAPGAISANLNDGIMVVGAHHHTGVAVTPSEAFSGSHGPGVVSAPLPSNFGACVDVWAPGNSIVSSWGIQRNLDSNIQLASGLPLLSPGPHTVVGTQYTGNVSSLYVSTDGWLFLSGTSMAAPHIAGAAAYVADAFNLGTPAQIEQKLRTLFRPYDYLDANLQGVKFKDPDNLPVHSVELQ